MAEQKFTAIEIDSPEVWRALCAIQPELKELDEEFNKGFFMLLDHPEYGTALCSPATIAEHFDHIEPGVLKIKTVQIVR